MKGNVISGTIKIKPIAKTGVTEVLVDQLLGFVTAGQLLPGDKLPSERELASRFAVSRPTVREALRALSVLGVIEIRHGGGAFVSALKADDLLGPLNFFLNLSDVSVEMLYDARRLIEGEICALAASRVTEEDLSALKELITKQEAAVKDTDLYLDLDSEFHELLGEISDNPFFSRSAKSLNVLGIEFRKKAVNVKSMPIKSITFHKKILAALKAKNPEAARSAMVGHMNQVFATTNAGIEGNSNE
ncbi:MAG: FadR family transcriptional regulator [Rhizobiales bacterium]|nr:FadR family transcriptional regulator [Hyphomicrobiales bacterium]